MLLWFHAFKTSFLFLPKVSNLSHLCCHNEAGKYHNEKWQFSALRIYYFFVLLMHSSCLSTFSDMKYWIADKINTYSDFPQMSA